MKVKDIMTKNVKTCSSDTDLAAAVQLMWENNCGIVPVIDDEGKPIGVITDRDIAVAVATRNKLAGEVKVGEVMAGEVFSCDPNEDVKSALVTMKTSRVRRLPVVDNKSRKL
ncbi:MAG: CBS domain-containing protein [Acidobacteriota bacterium]